MSLRLPTFRSYEHHVDLLMDRLAAASTSSPPEPQVVVIAGHTGTGKTRIVQEFYRRLVQQLEPDGQGYHVAEIGLADVHREGFATQALEQWRAAVFPPDHAIADPRQKPGFIWLGTHLAPQQQARDDTVVLELRRQIRTYLLVKQLRQSLTMRSLESARKWVLQALRAFSAAGGGGPELVSLPVDLVAALDLAQSSGSPAKFTEALSEEDSRAFMHELDKAIGFRVSAEDSIPGGAALTPVVLVVDDAHAISPSGASVLLDLLDLSRGAARPILVVITTWLHQLRDPATPIHELVDRLRMQSADLDAEEVDRAGEELLHEIVLDRVTATTEVGADDGRLGLDDLVAILEDSLPSGEGVHDRDAILDVLGRRLARMRSTSPRVAMRICAEAADRIARNRVVDVGWAEGVDLALEPGLELRYEQLPPDDRALVEALVDHRSPVLLDLLSEEDQRRVQDLTGRDIVSERSGTFRVVPELAELIGDGRAGIARDPDPRGIRGRMASRMDDLCRRLLAREPGVAAVLAGIDLARDPELLAAAPQGSVFEQMGRVLGRDSDAPDGDAGRLSDVDRAALLALAVMEPALVAVMTENIVVELVNQGPAGVDFQFAADLSGALLKGLGSLAADAPLARRTARSLCMTVGLDDLVEHLGADEELRGGLTEIAIVHADRDVVLMEALLRLAAAELLDDDQLGRLHDLVPAAVARVPRKARDFLTVAPAWLREPIEVAVRGHLAVTADLPLATSLLTMSDPISARTAAMVEESVLRSLRAFAAASARQDGPAVSEGDAHVRQLVHAVRQLLKSQKGRDEPPDDELLDLVGVLVRHDRAFGLSLLRDVTDERRASVWSELILAAGAMSPDELVRLLRTARSDEERNDVLRLVRSRAMEDPDVAARWLLSTTVTSSVGSDDASREEAFGVVRDHAQRGRPDLLATLVRAAPDASRRQAVLEHIRAQREWDLPLLLTLLHDRILPDTPENVRETLRQHLDEDARAALALLRLAEDDADVELATSSAARSIARDPVQGVSSLLAETDPWMTAHVSRAVGRGIVLRQLRYRVKQRQWNAADHLAEMGVSPSSSTTLVRRILAGDDGLDPWGLSAAARLAITEESRSDVREAVRSASQSDAGDTRIARAALLLHEPGEPERSETLDALTALLGTRPGVAAMLAEEGVDDPDLIAHLRDEAVLDPRSAVALSRFDPEAALPFLEARRGWHPPSAIAWAAIRPHAGSNATDDIVAMTATALTVGDDARSRRIGLPSDPAARDSFIDLLLQVDPERAAARLGDRSSGHVLDELVGRIRVGGGLQPSARRLLATLAGRISEGWATASLRRISTWLEMTFAPTLAWDNELARIVVRDRLHERLESFDRFVARAVMAATPSVLIELAPLIPELERPDLRTFAASRLRAMMDDARRRDDLERFSRLSVAWAHNAHPGEHFSEADAVSLERGEDRADVVAAVVRAGLPGGRSDRSDAWERRAVEHAMRGDEACLAVLLRGDLARRRPPVIAPVNLAELAARSSSAAVLVAWVRVGSGFRDELADRGRDDLVQSLDGRVDTACREDARVARAVIESSLDVFMPLRWPARELLVKLSTRSSAIAGRTLLGLRPRPRRVLPGQSRKGRRRRSKGPLTLRPRERDRILRKLVADSGRDEHARMILGLVLVRSEDLGEDPPAPVRKFLDIVDRRKGDCVVSAVVGLLVGSVADLPAATEACRRHHLVRPDRFIRVIRAIVPDLGADWWRSRVASVHEPGSPLDRSLRRSLDVGTDVPMLDEVRSARVGRQAADVGGVVAAARGLIAKLLDAGPLVEERHRCTEDLRALLPDLTVRAAAERRTAVLLADAADLLGHTRRVTRSLLEWADAEDEEPLIRCAWGVRDQGEVPAKLVRELRTRAASSIGAAEALALIARTHEERDVARGLIAAHLEGELTEQERWRLATCLHLLASDPPWSAVLDGAVPDGWSSIVVAGEVLDRLPEAMRDGVVTALASRRELVGLRRAVTHLDPETRSDVFLWVADLPRGTAGRTDLLLRLARGDGDFVRAKQESPDDAYRASVPEAIFADGITDPERLTTLAPFGSPVREAVLEELRRRWEGGGPEARLAAVASLNLLIDGRRRTAIDAALYRVADDAGSDPSSTVGFIDALKRMSDDAMQPSSEFRARANRALAAAVDAGHLPAIIRAIVASTAAPGDLPRRAREAIVPGTPLAEAIRCVDGEDALLPEHLLDADVQTFIRLALRPVRVTDGKLRSATSSRRMRVIVAADRAWSGLDEQQRVAVLDALPEVTAALRDPGDLLEAFRLAPRSVAPRFNRLFVECIREHRRQDERSFAEQVRLILMEHAGRHLSCAVALAQLGTARPGEVRQMIEPYRLHEPGLVLVALSARTHVARIAHQVMDRAGDPLVDQLVDIIGAKFDHGGSIRPDELWLLTSIATHLRPRHRGMVRRVLRVTRGLSKIHRLEILASLAETPTNRREVWSMTYEYLSEKHLRLERLVDLAWARPAEFDADALVRIDRQLASFRETAAIGARLDLRSDGRFPPDSLEPELIESALARTTEEPYEVARTVLRHADDPGVRQRAVRAMIGPLVELAGDRRFDRAVEDVVELLRDREHEALHDLLLGSAGLDPMDLAVVHRFLGTAAERVGALESFGSVATDDARAARELARAVIREGPLTSGLDAGKVADVLARHAPSDPELAALMLAVFAGSGVQPHSRVRRIVEAAAAAPQPEVFNEISRLRFSGVWLVTTFGATHPFLWGLLGHLEERALASEEAAILSAEIAPYVSPCSVPSARAALRTHEQTAALAEALRRLDATPHELVEGLEYLSGPLGVRLFTEARAQGRLKELAGRPDGQDVDPLIAARIAARLEVAPPAEREAAWAEALGRVSDDWSMAWLLAVVELDAQERESVARILRRQATQGGAFPVLVARTLGDRMSAADIARLEERLRTDPSRLIAVVLLLDPNVDWFVALLAERLRPLGPSVAGAVLKELRAGAEFPQLVRILAAADERRFLGYLQERLGSDRRPAASDRDARMLEALGRGVAGAATASVRLLDEALGAVKAADSDALDEVALVLQRRLRADGRSIVTEDAPRRHADGPVETASTWRRLAGMLDKRQQDAVRRVSGLRPEQIDRVLPPGSIERLRAFRALQAFVMRDSARSRETAAFLRLRRDLFGEGERFFLPPWTAEHVQALIDDEEVLVEALLLPVSTLTAQHFLDLYPLLESLTTHLARGSTRVAAGLVDVLRDGHPLAHRLPQGMSAGALELLEGSLQPSVLLSAVLSGSDPARERMHARLDGGDGDFAAVVGRRWPLDHLEDPIVASAAGVPSGAVALDRRLRALAHAPNIPQLREVVRRSLKAGLFDDLSCVIQLLAGPDGPERSLAREQLPQLAAEVGPSGVAEHCDALAAAGLEDDDAQTALDALGPLSEDPDVALAIVRAPGPAGRLLRAAVRTLAPVAEAEPPVAALILPLLEPAEREAILRRGSVSLVVEVAGLAIEELPHEQRSSVAGSTDRGLASKKHRAAVCDTVTSLLVRAGPDVSHIVGALAPASVLTVRSHLNQLGGEGSEVVALAELRFITMAHRIGAEVDLTAQSVGRRLLRAASGQIPLDELRADESIREVVNLWWGRTCLDSPARDLVVRRSITLSQPSRAADAVGEWTYVRGLGSMAVVQRNGILGLAPGSELMLALDPAREWPPGSPIDGAVEPGTAFLLEEYVALNDQIGIPLLSRPRASKAPGSEAPGADAGADGQVIAGVLLPPLLKDDSEHPASRVWLPQRRAMWPLAHRSVAEGDDPEGPLDRFYLLEFPVVLHALPKEESTSEVDGGEELADKWVRYEARMDMRGVDQARPPSG